MCKFAVAVAVSTETLNALQRRLGPDPKDALVYDAKSHRYLRIATAEDAGKWLGAEVIAVITLHVDDAQTVQSKCAKGYRNSR